jgi:N-methylhydantoinase A
VETPSAGRAGIDIGGTFTDLLLWNPGSGRFSIGKTLTTPDDPSRAVLDGLAALLEDAGTTFDRLGQIVHGTTLVTNALIERKGAPTALLTTKGFRDAVEIGREHRYDLYDLFLDLPEPLVPRWLRLELDERVLADGTVLEPLNAEQVREIGRSLGEHGVEAVAVCLLHAYRNPAHERQVEAVLRETDADLTISLSSDVSPEIREYERASTTIANVYVRPVVARYLGRLEETLAEAGFAGRLFVMLSSGGVATVETAQRYPIRLVESGPAGGALAAAGYGRGIGLDRLLSFDMGGTTAKACLIEGGQPLLSPQFEVNRVYRFKKGSGLPIRTPVIDLIEIGAGGGSVARVDRLGLLKVGPDSAGSVPGPACYGQGGTLPTVTDADLVLGYLDPNYFLGGRMTLDVQAAKEAISRQVAEPLGLTMLEAAWGIHQVVNENMAGAARMHAVEQGKDPASFPLFAFGGAGPVHAYRVAEILGSPSLVIPLGAGVTSTVGFLAASLAFDFVRTYPGLLAGLDWGQVGSLFSEMEAQGRSVLASAGVAEGEIGSVRSAEMRYAGQGHEISVPLDGLTLDASGVPALECAFAQAYRHLYERVAPGNPIEVVSWRLRVSGPVPVLPLDQMSPADGPRTTLALEAVKADRAIYLPEYGKLASVPVYDRYQLAPGAYLAGPAIVEERETTIVLGPRARARVDPFQNLVVEMAEPILTWRTGGSSRGA